MRRSLAALRLVILLLWLPDAAVAAAEALRVAGQWRTEDGLPLDSVTALAVDHDGYLWIGTTDGLARFDGTRFQTFHRDSTPPLPENRVARLHTLADGSLIVHLESETFGRFSAREGFLPIGSTGGQQLAATGNDLWYLGPTGLGHWQAREGTRIALPLDASALAVESPSTGGALPALLLGTRSGRLLRYQPDRGTLAELASLNPARPVLGIDSGPGGDIAFASSDGLYRLAHTRATAPLPQARLPAHQPLPPEMAWTPDGFVLNALSQHADLTQRPLFDGRRLLPVDDARFNPVSSNRLALIDNQGRHWINHGNRLSRDGETVYTGPSLILDFAIDRYDQVWLGTLRDGLIKLVKPTLATIGNQPGELRDSNVYLVTTDQQGGLLVGSYHGLDRYTPADQRWTRLRDQHSLAVLADGDTLLVAGETLCRMPATGGDCVPVDAVDRGAGKATLLYRDQRGTLWASSSDGLYLQQADQGWFGPLRTGARLRDALELDDGRLLLASADRGVLQTSIDDPLRSPRTLIDESGGLPSNRVRAPFHDQGDDVLIGLEDRGICLFHIEKGLGRCIGVAEGLPHHSVHRMIADDQGRLWINSNDGLYALDRAELRTLLRGHGDRIGARRFGVADGMASSEGNGGVYSAGTRTPDGRLWFPTQRGVVVLQPEGIRPQAFPLIATVRPRDPRLHRLPISLPPDRRVLPLRLGAIALRGRADLQLRWRLGDRDWVITRPGELVLDGLPPGVHRFEVEARYAESGWGEPTSLTFEVPHRLSELGSVRIGGILLVAALLVALFARERSHARRLERRVHERTESLQSALRTVAAQAEQIRAAADHRLQWYLAISHELRTPLTGLLAPLEGAEPPTARQRERMRRGALQMRDMIEQLLVLERLDHEGGTRLRPERLAPLVRRAVEPTRSALQDTGVELRVETGEAGQHEGLRVMADAAQLERAIAALVGNALAHGETRRGEPGRRRQIQIRLEPAADCSHVLLHVDDDGPGIAPSERERVLRPFIRGNTEASQGSGLGLALCQRIVQQHHGHLDIGDSLLGGARISLRLPVLQDAAEAADGRAPPEAPVVLVVDDDNDIRGYLGELLGQHYSVLLAADGEEGQRIASAELPDAIVSDINMPGIDGIEMVRRLRRGPETSVIPVIFLTAYGQQDVEARAFSAGGDQFLAKPFRPEQVLLRIERMLAYRRDLLARHPPPASPPTDAPALEPQRRAGLMERFATVIEQRLGDPDLDIDELCRELGVSRATLYRRIETSDGLSPTDYLRAMRLDRAASLLRDTDEQVSAVAYAVGFRRLSAFTRSFTARFGCAPSLYRRSAREAALPPS